MGQLARGSVSRAPILAGMTVVLVGAMMLIAAIARPRAMAEYNQRYTQFCLHYLDEFSLSRGIVPVGCRAREKSAHVGPDYQRHP